MYFEWPEEDKKVGQLTGVSLWVGGCFQGDGFYNRVPHSDTPPPPEGAKMIFRSIGRLEYDSLL